jgi:hypothetical protein
MHLVSNPTSPGYGHTSTIIATMNGVFFAGGFLGCLFAALAGSSLGRLRGFQAAAIVGIIGSTIQTAEVNPAMVSLLIKIFFNLNYSNMYFRSTLLQDLSRVSLRHKPSLRCLYTFPKSHLLTREDLWLELTVSSLTSDTPQQAGLAMLVTRTVLHHSHGASLKQCLVSWLSVYWREHSLVSLLEN